MLLLLFTQRASINDHSWYYPGQSVLARIFNREGGRVEIQNDGGSVHFVDDGTFVIVHDRITPSRFVPKRCQLCGREIIREVWYFNNRFTCNKCYRDQEDWKKIYLSLLWKRFELDSDNGEWVKTAPLKFTIAKGENHG